MAGNSNGGRRLGAGRTPNVEGRVWARKAVDDPARREAVLRAIDRQLAEGNTQGFESLFRHGYGAPPTNGSLSVALGGGDGPVEFVCVFDDGTEIDAAASAAAPVPDEIPS